MHSRDKKSTLQLWIVLWYRSLLHFLRLARGLKSSVCALNRAILNTRDRWIYSILSTSESILQNHILRKTASQCCWQDLRENKKSAEWKTSSLKPMIGSRLNKTILCSAQQILTKLTAKKCRRKKIVSCFASFMEWLLTITTNVSLKCLGYESQVCIQHEKRT